jgi:hypothetical protein
MYGKDYKGIGNLSNGNLTVGDTTAYYTTLEQKSNDAFTAITNAANSMNQALAPIISIAAYGKGSGGSTFSPYYTPGYGDTSSLSSIPYNSPYATQPQTASYSGVPSNSVNLINTTVNLDGQKIAQSTSQYRSQQMGRGFSGDS